MAVSDFVVKVEGLSDLKAALGDIAPQLRKKVILSALRKAARIPLLAAKQAVPVMGSELASKVPYRTAGLLKSRLMVRTSKAARSAGNLGVFINVKPAAGAKYKTTRSGGAVVSRRLKSFSQRGAYSKYDPFYWRFVEFGTKKMGARKFIQPAAETLPQALQVFMAEVIPAIERFNRRK